MSSSFPVSRAGAVGTQILAERRNEEMGEGVKARKPGRVARLVAAASLALQGHGFDSQSEHTLRLQVRFLVGMRVGSG